MITSGHISHQPAIIKDIVELALPGRKVKDILPSNGSCQLLIQLWTCSESTHPQGISLEQHIW